MTTTETAVSETPAVDLTETNEIFAEGKLSAVDVQGLLAIKEHLTALGLQPRLTPNGTVEAELVQCGQAYALGIFVSGSEVFYRDDTVDAAIAPGRNLHNVLERNFERKQAHWAGNTKTTLEKNMFIVRADGDDADALFMSVMLAVELNVYHAPKMVCTMRELDQLTRSAFNPVAHRAHQTPAIGVGRTSIGEFDAPFPFVDQITLPFKPQCHSELVSELASRGNRVAIKRLTGKLFRRLMGFDYRLVEGDEWPEVARGNNDWSMPAGLGMLSTGEETALTFCLFLALAHDAVVDGMCLGIRDSLNRLDTVRQFKAYGLLRDFIAATGASVCIQTDKSDVQAMATRRMQPGVNLAIQAAQHR